MENFCQRGKIEHKDGYDVCRGVEWQSDLRYDLTLLYPDRQTAGHYHTSGFPELFEVLSGNALFLTQNSGAPKTYLISAKEKEKIVILPEFSIRTINPSKDKELMISNWISDKTTNDYNAFKNLQEPIKLKPKKLPKELENLDFLNNPEKYKNILTIENLYEQIWPR
jgi:oxalate decarboxylase/phosphoglucose isomerase-like protein (cupin superfamily)